MIKKISKRLAIIAVVMGLSLTGCGNKASSEEPTTTEQVVDSATVSEAAVLEETTTEEVTTEEVIEEVEPFLMYLTGYDVWGWVGETSRSDVNLLMAVNPQTHQVALVSTPRDFYVPLSVSGGVKDKLTHAGLYGTQCSIDTMNMLYDVNIDYYFRVNFSGFEAIINGLGGIDPWTDYDFTVEPIKHYEVGYNHLTGLEALAFVRERYSFTAGDRVRGIHQMSVVKAIINKITEPSVLEDYSKYVDGLSEFYQTDLPKEKLIALIKTQLKEGGEWQIATHSSDGYGIYGVTYSCGDIELSVIEPDYDTVAEGTKLIKGILEGKLIKDLGVEEESHEGEIPTNSSEDTDGNVDNDSSSVSDDNNVIEDSYNDDSSEDVYQEETDYNEE